MIRTCGRRFALACALACALVVVASAAAASRVDAQESGGSFGGGDWSDSSGSSDWGSSSGSSDWGSSDWSSTDYGSSGGGGGGGDGGVVFAGLALLAFVIFSVIMFAGKQEKSARRRGGGRKPGGAGGRIRVSTLSLGLDWRARKDLQALLDRLGRTGDMSRPKGRADALREVAQALARAEASWLYVTPSEPKKLPKSDAQRVFTERANEYRARFRREVVRNEQGDVRTVAAPEMRARAEEGEGTVVVTLVVAARRDLKSLKVADGGRIHAALESLAKLGPNDLVALEVIWSPAAENDRMSTAELEQNYPEMKLVDPNSIAGRVFCVYCSGPFPVELQQCPHCGAPAADSRTNRDEPT